MLVRLGFESAPPAWETGAYPIELTANIFVGKPPCHSFVCGIKWENVASGARVKSVKHRVIEDRWIGQRGGVGNSTIGFHLVSNVLPFFSQLILNNTNCWFIIQKPFLENSNWRKLFHIRGSSTVKLKRHIVVSEYEVCIPWPSVHCKKKQLISPRAPSSCIVK